MKKVLLLLSLLTLVACSSANKPETNEQQIDRLLKVAEQKEKMRKEAELRKVSQIKAQKEAGVPENEIIIEEVVVEEMPVEQKVDPHKGKTRGEIMVYEMDRITNEMNAIDTKVQDYIEKDKALKQEKARFEKLKKLNDASMR